MGRTFDLSELAAVGSVLAGKYRIERVVGSGGMGVVALASHLRLGSPVAVKFMLPRQGGAERTPARFLKEARTASRITSPHVARVFDVDLRADGVPYIVMEYLEGETLASALRRRGPLGVEETVDDVLAVCEALAEAHALGIVHRDLKPANLFRARTAGRPSHVLKVLDFGISKTFEEESDQTASTTGGAFIGSPPYMSPEQLTRPAEVDARTDVWSLGVVLYECLTGSSPFLAASVAATCARILHDSPEPPSKLRPELPPGLDPCVLRCLEKSTDGRHPTIRELARSLAPFGSPAAARSLVSIESLPVPLTAPPRSEMGESAELPPTATEGRTDPTSSLEGVMKTRPERPGLRKGAGAAVVGVLVVAAVAQAVRHWPRSDEGRQGAPPTTAAPHGSVKPSTASSPPGATPGTDPTPPPRGVTTEPATLARSGAAPRRPSPVRPPATAARVAGPAPSPASAPLAPPLVVTSPPPDPEAIYVDRK